MKISRFVAVFGFLFCTLFFSSCDLESLLKSFDYNLQGTWESNDGSVYSGTLVITYGTITITGYLESQTPLLGDDDERPFKGFIKGIPLEGYSENGKIFIKNVSGNWQNGIPYDYSTANYGLYKFLGFSFAGREELLQKIN